MKREKKSRVIPQGGFFFCLFYSLFIYLAELYVYIDLRYRTIQLMCVHTGGINRVREYIYLYRCMVMRFSKVI